MRFLRPSWFPWFGLLALAGLANNQLAAQVGGTYVGTYVCGQGTTGLMLTVKELRAGKLSAEFTFFLDDGDASHPKGVYGMTGTYDARTGQAELKPTKWVGLKPPGYVPVGMKGRFDVTTGRFTGTISYETCGEFSLIRESAAGPPLERESDHAPAPPAASPGP